MQCLWVQIRRYVLSLPINAFCLSTFIFCLQCLNYAPRIERFESLTASCSKPDSMLNLVKFTRPHCIPYFSIFTECYSP